MCDLGQLGAVLSCSKMVLGSTPGFFQVAFEYSQHVSTQLRNIC